MGDARDRLVQLMGQKPATGAVAPAPAPAPPVQHIPSARTVNFLSEYELGRDLGSGSFSSVRTCTNRKTRVECAVKIMKKSPMMNYEALRKEVDILSKVRHPHVVRLYDTIEDAQHVYLIMELMRGGELFDRVVKEFPHGYTERVCSALFKNLLSAVAYLHSLNIIHRDLKPENLLLSDASAECADVKVSDFGFATSRFQARSACGSPCYLAPEIIRNAAAIQRASGSSALPHYTNAVDVWSLGVILYVMLCGFAPFREPNLAQLFQKILDCEYSFPSPQWDKVSDSAKDLVRRMVVSDPALRISAADALRHQWLNPPAESDEASAAATGVPGGPVLNVSASLANVDATGVGAGRGRGTVDLTAELLGSLHFRG